METNKIIEVVEQETSLLEHIMYQYDFLFDNSKYQLANGKFSCPGEDFKKEVTAVINSLKETIGIG